MRRAVVLIALILILEGCGLNSKNAYTLYRNSPLELGHRVHFASFNAAESAEFNRGNCGMTARLLNANVVASAKAEGKMPITDTGFWCEPGAYTEAGQVPATFETAFPTTSDGLLSW